MCEFFWKRCEKGLKSPQRPFEIANMEGFFIETHTYEIPVALK